MDATTTPVATTIAVAPRDYVHDTIIYPGLYAPSGFDMMSILVRDGLVDSLPFPWLAYLHPCRMKNKKKEKENNNMRSPHQAPNPLPPFPANQSPNRFR